MGTQNLSDFFKESEMTDDIFSILEAFENASDCNTLSSKKSPFLESEIDAAAEAASPKCKRQKLSAAAAVEDGQPRMLSHISVERNRRKQMNEHISVLRSLMPCFYVKRGDQASIIGGVVNYIKELQQILQSMEAKKQRKAYADVLSPRPGPLSPMRPALSPILSPRTPQPSSPYKPRLGFLNSPSLPSPAELSPCNSSTNDSVNELVATSRSAVAEVEVKFCGPNLLLKTVSHSIPGQVVKIVSALEDLALQILQVNVNKLDEKMLHCFTIKIGIECQLSAQELAEHIQQTFC
uniref:Basic helix-loop-helix transcription factor n=1 Tax=Salvia miltiorrhiza TaxID=226208 RepID=A0A0H3Y903_SALMI|nr:basic helix-loop-helix transcription factor [Salvia miltiorrhiza]